MNITDFLNQNYYKNLEYRVLEPKKPRTFEFEQNKAAFSLL